MVVSCFSWYLHFTSPGFFHGLWTLLKPILALLLFESVCDGCSRRSSSLPREPMSYISESIRLLIVSTFAGFWLLGCTGSITYKQKMAFARGIRIPAKLTSWRSIDRNVFSKTEFSVELVKFSIKTSGRWANNLHTNKKSLFSECMRVLQWYTVTKLLMAKFW